ncbi:hypothetical protein XENOCAPTIV_005107 [Xenoophorus captivus]|uniref:Uncharacterized protein n=1 Tax=Xenoophorus captivus TaxID=1517983 RepID=A0ABV0Q4G7_9TELE
MLSLRPLNDPNTLYAVIMRCFSLLCWPKLRLHVIITIFCSERQSHLLCRRTLRTEKPSSHTETPRYSHIRHFAFYAAVISQNFIHGTPQTAKNSRYSDEVQCV